MNPPYKITARNLGNLALADPCLSCFWWLSNIRFHAPFDFGAAIFRDCQAMQEAVIGHFLDTDGSLPKEFAPFCDIKERMDVNKRYDHFGYMHESGVWLYGEPDEVMRRKDNTGVIWDHKTAHPKVAVEEADGTAAKGKKKEDRFRPMYDIQVSGYALIGEVGLNLGRFSAGALCYWDVQHKAVVADPESFIDDGMFYAAFAPVIYEVELDYSTIDDLLKEALKVWKSKVPPEGRKGCKDCRKLQALLAIHSEVEDTFTVQDRAMLAASGNDPWVYQMIAKRIQDRTGSRFAALHEIREAGESLQFEDDGMASRWEHFG